MSPNPLELEFSKVRVSEALVVYTISIVSGGIRYIFLFLKAEFLFDA
jgi:hypothetical protein